MSTIVDMSFSLRWILHSQKVRWTTALNSVLLDTVSMMSLQMLRCKCGPEVGADHNMAVLIADPRSDKCSCSSNLIKTIVVLLCAPSFPERSNYTTTGLLVQSFSRPGFADDCTL